MINLPLKSVMPRQMAAKYPQRPQMQGGGMGIPMGLPPMQGMPGMPGPSPDAGDMYGDMAGMGLSQLAGMFGSPAPTTQMAAPQGGLAQDLGVASVPGGIGNVAAPGQSQAMPGMPQGMGQMDPNLWRMIFGGFGGGR